MQMKWPAAEHPSSSGPRDRRIFSSADDFLSQCLPQGHAETRGEPPSLLSCSSQSLGLAPPCHQVGLRNCHRHGDDHPGEPRSFCRFAGSGTTPSVLTSPCRSRAARSHPLQVLVWSLSYDLSHLLRSLISVARSPPRVTSMAQLCRLRPPYLATGSGPQSLSPIGFCFYGWGGDQAGANTARPTSTISRTARTRHSRRDPAQPKVSTEGDQRATPPFHLSSRRGPRSPPTEPDIGTSPQSIPKASGVRATVRARAAPRFTGRSA